MDVYVQDVCFGAGVLFLGKGGRVYASKFDMTVLDQHSLVGDIGFQYVYDNWQDLFKNYLDADVKIHKLGKNKASPNPLEPLDEHAKLKMTNYAKIKSEDLLERLFSYRQKKIEAAGLDFTSFKQTIERTSHFRGEDLVKLGLVDGLATYQDGKRLNHVDAKDLHLWVPYQSDPLFKGSHSRSDLEGSLASRFQLDN